MPGGLPPESADLIEIGYYNKGMERFSFDHFRFG